MAVIVLDGKILNKEMLFAECEAGSFEKPGHSMIRNSMKEKFLHKKRGKN